MRCFLICLFGPLLIGCNSQKGPKEEIVTENEVTSFFVGTYTGLEEGDSKGIYKYVRIKTSFKKLPNIPKIYMLKLIMCIRNISTKLIVLELELSC